jgi:hypothetical protein
MIKERICVLTHDLAKLKTLWPIKLRFVFKAHE